MAYISVDIDLDEFDTDELVHEVCSRLKNARLSKVFSDKYRKELKESFGELQKTLSLAPTDNIQIKNLEDKMKYEHLVKIFDKYNSSYIEKMLPE